MTEVVTPLSPYKGLAPFEDSERDAMLFFGREREREIIAANLTAYRLTVLYGASGVGKSSVLRAGVVYQMRRTALENKERLGHPQHAVAAFSGWSGDPVGELLTEVREELATLFGGEVVAPARKGLAASLDTWCSELGCELYLVLDQMDEYFLYHDEDDTFAREFAEAATREGLRVNFVVAIREDMLAKLDQFKGRIPNLFSNYLRLDHLDREAARAAIEGPIARHNELAGPDQQVAIGPGLVETVLDQTVAGRVRLVEAEPAEERLEHPGRVEAPYLQLVMQRLWEEEHHAGERTLRLSTLERLGGATQIVRRHLTSALEALNPSEQDLAETLFNYLVTPSGTKIAHGLGDLAEYAAVSEGSVQLVLSTLAHERIVRRVSDGGEPNGGRYEIYHDVLAEPVAAWRARHAADRQLAEERRAAERRHRRMFVVTALSLVALAAMTLVAIFALAQRREARNQREVAQNQRKDAQAARLTSQAQAALFTDPADGVRNAIRAAVLRPDTPGVADVLRTTLINMNERGILSSGGGPVRAAEFGRNGSLVLVAGTAQARVYWTRSHRLRREIEAGSKLHDADLTPDGKFVVTVGSDGAARVWSVRTGKLVHAFRRGHVTSGSISDDGKWLVTVSRDRAARIWTMPGGPVVHEFHEPLHALAAVLSPDDSRIVVITEGHAADLYDVGTESQIQHLEHRSLVRNATFDPRSRLLATTSGKVELLWDARTGAYLRTLERPDIAHANPIVSAAFSPHGTLIVTADGADAAARVYDTGSGALITVLTGPVQAVTDASFSPRGDLIVTTSNDRSARLYRPPGGGPVAELLGNGRELTGASWAPDGRALVTASKGGIARLWDPNLTAQPLLQRLGSHRRNSPVRAVSFNADGTLAVSAGADNTARVWQIGHGLIGILPHRKPVTDAVFAGPVVVTASADGTARIWRPRGGAPLRTLRHGGRVDALAVGSGGRLIATGGANGAVELWSRGGRRFWKKHQGGDITSAAFSPDGQRLVTSSTNATARIWRVSDGRSLHRLKGHRGAVVQAAFSPSGRYVATGEDSTARIWEAGTGKPLNRNLVGLGGQRLMSIAFNPSGTVLATADHGGGLRLLSVPSGKLLHDLHPHVSAINEIAFSHDGRWLVTAGPSKAAVLRVSTGQRLLLLRARKKAFTSVAFSPRGLRILTGGEDGSVRTYECRVCARLPGLIALGRERLKEVRPRP